MRMSASSSYRILRRSPKGPPIWCARWWANACRSLSPVAIRKVDLALGRGHLGAIDRAWSDAGVAILVDLGGAETNSEMANRVPAGGTSGACRHLQCTAGRGSGDRRHREFGRLAPFRREGHGRGAFPMMEEQTPFAGDRRGRPAQSGGAPCTAGDEDDAGCKRLRVAHRTRDGSGRAVDQHEESRQHDAGPGPQGRNRVFPRRGPDAEQAISLMLAFVNRKFDEE